MNLFEHSPDCEPLMPCQACEVVAWLRTKLAPADFDELVERARALNGPPKRTYRRRPRPPAAEPQAADNGLNTRA